MNYSKDFSVIVPTWRGAIQYLPRLFDSIPEKDGIEIIVVDNSLEPINREEIKSKRNIVLLHSAPDRHAGGSRNEGIVASNGKWLLFADSDDYYSIDAFDIYYEHVDTEAEIVYTGMGGVYDDTGEPSDRGDIYAQLVHDYCNGIIDDATLRFSFSSPCCKMVSHDLVTRHNLRYDEIRAGNDNYFSITSGFYAKSIIAIDKVTYIASVNRGSLTKRSDYNVLRARFYAKLHCNQFFRQHHLSNRQYSVMYALVESRKFGASKMFELFRMLFKFHQNPFIGWKNWIKTVRTLNRQKEKDIDYVTK